MRANQDLCRYFTKNFANSYFIANVSGTFCFAGYQLSSKMFTLGSFRIRGNVIKFPNQLGNKIKFQTEIYVSGISQDLVCQVCDQ